MSDQGFYFHVRERDGDNPGGLTVSRSATLPAGDFQITEHRWGSVSLWFVNGDNFTADERQKAYTAIVRSVTT